MQIDPSAKNNIDYFADQLRKPEVVLFWEYLDRKGDARQLLDGLKQVGCDPLILMTDGIANCNSGGGMFLILSSLL